MQPRQDALEGTSTTVETGTCSHAWLWLTAHLALLSSLSRYVASCFVLFLANKWMPDAMQSGWFLYFRTHFSNAQDIAPDSELLYDYGERDPAVIAEHPWLLS